MKKGTSLLLVWLIIIFVGLLYGSRPTQDPLYKPYEKKFNLKVQAQLSRAEAWDNFRSEYGNGWRVRWNETTGLPHRVWGAGIDITQPQTAEEATAVCKAFMKEHPRWFSYKDVSLEVLSAKNRQGIWYVIFREYYDGTMVWQGRVDFRINEGAIVLFGADIHPDIVGLSTKPSLSRERAIALAKSDYKFDKVADQLVIFPSEGEYRLAWWLQTEKSAPYARDNIFIDANTGAKILHYNNLPTGVPGKVTGDILPEFNTDPLDTAPLPYLTIESMGGVITQSDARGGFNLNIILPSTGMHCWAYLSGDYADVTNASDSRGTWSEKAYPAESLLVHWSKDDNADLAEINVFYHTNYVHDFYKELDPAFVGLDYPMPIVVNDTVSPTPDNAFWNGIGMHFGKGSRCSNFGHFADVIYHEYTHGVTHMIYPLGTLPYIDESGAINEAFSDYFACTILDDPIHGEKVCGATPFRDLTEFLTMDDWVGEVHADGNIISGAWWEIRDELGVDYCDNLVHFTRYGAPETFEDLFIEMLILDDDDGDLHNGTPNFWTIVNPYLERGIITHFIKITHRPLYDTEDILNSYTVRASISSILLPDDEEIKVYYSLDSSDFASVLMSYNPGAGVDSIIGQIPAQPQGTEVRYYIEVADTIGNFERYPMNAPNSVFTFNVLRDTVKPVIIHTALQDQGAFAHPFLIEAVVSDNLGPPEVMIIASKNSMPADTFVMARQGEDLYKGRLDFGSVTVGDTVSYQIIAMDKAAEGNVAKYPEVNKVFHVVQSTSYSFDDGDDNFIASGDWARGTPSVIGPDSAYSPPNLWATNLNGGYSNKTTSQLASPEISLVDYSAATLEFYHYYEIEAMFDGGDLNISTDGGASWTYIKPVGGYDGFRALTLGHEGFSGYRDYWHKVHVDLTPYVGDSIRIKFDFKAGATGTEAGWYIDDFAIIDKQVLLPPPLVMAESSWDAFVPLYWRPPSTVHSDSSEWPENFVGYNIYRSTNGIYFDYSPINNSPIRDTSYIDSAVTNGANYYYKITTVFSRGESERSEVVKAMPCNPEIVLSFDSLYIPIPLGTKLDTPLHVANFGTGELTFEVFEHEMHPDSAKCANTKQTSLPPSLKQWRLLAEDPEEPGVDLNLKALYAQHNSGNFYAMTTAYGNIGNPREDFITGFMLDIDQDTTTGSDLLPGMGIEYIIAIGTIPYLGGEAIILKYDPSSPFYGWVPDGAPGWYEMSPGGDTIAMGLPLEDIGYPETFNIGAAILKDITTSPEIPDLIPNPGFPRISYNTTDVLWLMETPLAGLAQAGRFGTIDLQLDATGLSLWREYHAWLSIKNSDRDKGVCVVPITMYVVFTDVQEETKPHGEDELQLSAPEPNPFNSSVSLDYYTPTALPVEISIFNIDGTRVCEMTQPGLAPGWHTFTWDGKDTDGKLLATGVYLIRMELEGDTSMRKIILMR